MNINQTGCKDMNSRKEIQASMESGLAKTEEKIDQLKADIEAAGDDATEESKDALAEAEHLWQQAKAKYEEVVSASDEQFEELRESVVEHWEELSARAESVWDSVSEKLKRMFS